MATVRVVFGRDGRHGVTAVHVDLPGQPLSLLKRPAARNSGAWPNAALGVLAVATVVAATRRRRRKTRKGPTMRAGGPAEVT